jgi:DNA-binding beta-propeller fold protein YncE
VLLAGAILGGALFGAGCEEEEPADPNLPLLPTGSAASIPSRVLVVNTLSETLSSLDPDRRTMTVQAAVVGTWTNRARVTPDARTILIANSGDNGIEVLNARDLSRRGEIDLGPGSSPWIAVPVSDHEAVVSNWLSNDVRLLRFGLGSAGPPIATAPGPEGVALRGRIAYVACTNFAGSEGSYGAGVLEVVDLEAGTRIRSIEVGTNPQDVIVTSDDRLHVLCTGDYGVGGSERGRVHVLDPETGETEEVLDVGGSPGRLAEDGQGIVWVAGFDGGVRRYRSVSLEVLPDPPDPTLRAPGFSGVAIDAVTGTVYVTNFDTDRLLAVDPEEAITESEWLVGDGPVDVLVVRPDR